MKTNLIYYVVDEKSFSLGELFLLTRARRLSLSLALDYLVLFGFIGWSMFHVDFSV